ncbi:MAG TPA: hypothetical protein VII42_10725 [Caulobacteraceae bacterium]|jgi:hypothetical protein
MSAFIEIARRAKRDHEARLELAKAHAQHERLLREQAFAKAVAALRANIVPVLHKARAELASDGIPLVIEDNFHTCTHGRAAEVSIRIVGPEIPSRHSGRVTPESAPAFFSHDGATLSFAMGRRGAQLADNVRPVLGEPSSVIEHAIAQAAASYFADIEAAARPEPTRA